MIKRADGRGGKRIDDERKKAEEEREDEQRQADAMTFWEKEQGYERMPAAVMEAIDRSPQENVRLRAVYDKEEKTGIARMGDGRATRDLR